MRDLPGNTAELAVVPGSSVPARVIVTAAAAVVLAGGTVLIRRRKKAPVKQAEEKPLMPCCMEEGNLHMLFGTGLKMCA